MKSHWDLGMQPRKQGNEAAYRRAVAAYQGVSTFETPAAAAAKARTRNLGEYIAELEVPESMVGSRTASTGHVGLKGTTPEQLLGCVRSMVRVDDV